jgi:hypothetical protein
VVPATQEVEVGESWSDAGPRQKCENLSEKHNKKQKHWGRGSSGRALD